MTMTPFLRIPPFPGQRAKAILGEGRPAQSVEADAIIDALRTHRVGGAFWGKADPWQDGATGDDAERVALIKKRKSKALRDWIDTEIGERRWLSPFTGQDMPVLDLIALLGGWRSLIESNRDIAAVTGVASWKRPTLDPLLWDGTRPVPYVSRVPASLKAGDRVVAWKSRTAPGVLAGLVDLGAHVDELEDGFIRSSGLGADCVPPLSVVLDTKGIYFDPNHRSDLEILLQSHDFSAEELAEAARVRALLNRTGLSKYEGGRTGCLSLPRDTRRKILVVGQVEDDRSILTGGEGMTNAKLIAAARRLEGADAWIAYKPHPDVEAGHRPGALSDGEVLAHADTIVRDGSIAEWIEATDGLHTITSLAGFEALLRGKAVTCHGTPFYAGWSLTRDEASPRPFRKRNCSIDMLVAATLLLYPRRVDPVTRLPCATSLLVERLANGEAEMSSPLITLRRLQGRVRRQLRRLWERS